jgi:hypothetical protein
MVTYQISRRYNPEDSRLHTCLHENLKSHLSEIPPEYWLREFNQNSCRPKCVTGNSQIVSVRSAMCPDCISNCQLVSVRSAMCLDCISNCQLVSVRSAMCPDSISNCQLVSVRSAMCPDCISNCQLVSALCNVSGLYKLLYSYAQNESRKKVMGAIVDPLTASERIGRQSEKKIGRNK